MNEKLTLQEIIKELGRAFSEGDTEAIRDIKDSYGDDKSIESILHSLVNDGEGGYGATLLPNSLKLVSEEGGEGEGEYAHVVFQYLPTNQYIGFEGWYASYEGFDWSDSNLQEFEPRQTIEYVAKK